MALEAAVPLGVPYIVHRQFRQDLKPDRYILNDYRFLVDEKGTLVKKTVELCTPIWDKAREIFVVWDDVDRKVYYTDTDLLQKAKESTLEEYADNKTKKSLLRWRELIEGFPYFAHGTWNYFFTKARMRYPISVDKVNIRYSILTAPSGKRYRKYTARVGRFFAELKDYTPGTPLPEDLEWQVSVPETPWAQTFSKLHGGFALDNRLVRVADLPHVVFLVDDALRRTLFWDKKSRKWEDYIVRDPGCGPYFGLEFQRRGVLFDNDLGVFVWRDPVTTALYALVQGDDYTNPLPVTDVQLRVEVALKGIEDLIQQLPAMMLELDNLRGLQFLMNKCRNLENDIKGVEGLVGRTKGRLELTKKQTADAQDMNTLFNAAKTKVDAIPPEYRESVSVIVRKKMINQTLREADLPIIDELAKHFGELQIPKQRLEDILKRPHVGDLLDNCKQIAALHAEYKRLKSREAGFNGEGAAEQIQNKLERRDVSEKVESTTAKIIELASITEKLYSVFPISRLFTAGELRQLGIEAVNEERTEG